MMSVRKNNVETVKLLLQRNADVTVADSKDKTCLYIAAEENCVDAFEVSVLDLRFRCTFLRPLKNLKSLKDCTRYLG